MSTTNCPLCNHESILYGINTERRFFQCTHCSLIFLSTDQYLSPEEEATRYGLHNNNADDDRYVAYLDKIIDEVETHVPASFLAQGIVDFGACEEAVLTLCMQKRGYRVHPYDPLYNHTLTDVELPIGAIVASEVVEHFHTPLEEFSRMHSWLVDGGYLFIKTSLVDDVEDFAKWWYPKDPTHVQFYSTESFQWLCRHIGFELLYAQGNTVVMRKL